MILLPANMKLIDSPPIHLLFETLSVIIVTQFVLRTVHKESLLISNLISFPSVSPHPSSARAKAEGKTATSDGNDLPNTAVSLVPVLISLGPDSQTNHVSIL